jgi:hypothetical protein
MSDSLSDLEQRRFAIIEQISQLDDFRSGSITNTSGRCGKPNCRCHQSGQPGHGPNLRLTYKVAGKSVSESFSSLAALRKAEREIEEFRKFQQLSQQLVDVNSRICRLRPAVEHVAVAQEKKRKKRSSKKSAVK